MPVFVVTDAHGETSSFEIPRDVLEARGGVFEALAADDAPNLVALEDVGLGSVSAPQFDRAARASYASGPGESLARMGELLAADDWVALEPAVSWIGAREACAYLAASRATVTEATTDEFALRLHAWRGEWDLPPSERMLAPADRGRVFGSCVRRVPWASTAEVHRLFTAACWTGCVESAEFLWTLHQFHGLQPDVVFDPATRNSACFRTAARAGHLPILRFLWRLRREHGVGIDPTAETNDAFRSAAKAGHVPVLEFLWQLKKEDGVPVDPTAVNNQAYWLAASEGHVPVLEFLWRLRREEGVAVDPTTTYNFAFQMAATNGHLPVLEYLWRLRREEGVGIDPTSTNNLAFTKAAENDHRPVLAFLWRLRTEEGVGIAYSAGGFASFLLACRKGHLDALRFLWHLTRDEGAIALPVPIQSAMFKIAAANGRMSVLEFLWNLHSTGELEVTDYDKSAALGQAVREHNEEVVEFLHRVGIEGVARV